ncbi:MAG TPA: T9SS type A sorting domain-containing protein, partial [Chitinophagales bacterium]|nr:T9SS type A sorting domain-containing protein [Chitinophagales bacterium]
LSTGNYLVTITDNNGCTAASGVNVVESGIENTGSSAGFRLWPNPAKNQLHVTLTTTNTTTLDIKNVLGQIVVSANVTSQQSTIDVSQLVNGIYLAEVKQSGKKLVKQFVIAR